ncbi:MAG: cation:proton antiporter [Bacteroidales bacterium]|nr:cation:proton antiporter [Bacteroidales bacterium]MBN2818182.1 cation:proton antiporter [Bacteroidales bacterium]
MITAFTIHEPLFVFTILVTIILVSPFLFRIIKVPDVASFIIMGVLVGPHGFKILQRDSSIELLGTVGLLYIMFIAGLELDPEKLKKSRKNSFYFGFATFLIPFILGYFVSHYVLQLESQATLLVSIMFSTHTLVAYPIVRKLGIKDDIAVLTAVGGTIITDTLVLLILSIVTRDFNNGVLGIQIAQLVVSFATYTFIIFYTFPRIAKWFFKHIKRDRPVHYLFLLFMVSISSYIAKLLGTEPIIGAFLAGLALNKSIPKNSLLMHHVDFVGNVLFIPIFLIEIGMLINTRILISGTYLWFVAGILILTAFTGKWLAAFLSQKILNFSNIQRNLLFGLTSSHAAATIAIILIGYEKQIIDITFFNATVFIILVSSLVASFITEKSGKIIVLNTSFSKETNQSERILVPISNPSTMANLIGIANCFQKVNQSEPVYVINILNEDKSSRENILKIKESLETNVAEFNNLNENLKVITRVDLSISSGIIRAAKEYMATDIVFGWGDKSTPSQRLFGSVFDHLLNSLQTLYAIKIIGKHTDYDKIVVHIPSNLEFEPSFMSIILKLNKLPKAEDQLIFQTENVSGEEKIKTIIPRKNKHEIFYKANNCNISDNSKGTINVFFILRKQSVSYNLKNNSQVQKIISNENINNQIIVVPGYE